VSGIFGLLNQDGAPVDSGELRAMGSLLVRRGPDGADVWRLGQAGLGHTLLATTPESLVERQPRVHSRSGCVITADVRLDNRRELLDALHLPERETTVGDAALILAAYDYWGIECVTRLLGDFAFAIWDPRNRRLFCALDHFGMKPFYYHHTHGRFFAFASEPRAILVLPQTPYRINEGRIADFLVSELEGIDKTSTFFEEVYRLPPAHTVSVTPEGVTQRRYWSLEPGAELRLKSDAAYAEAFLDVFTEAVRCRLRSAGPVGSMLSGGMDSGSVVAVARRLLAEEGRGPLSTFSATSPDRAECIETRTIQSAIGMGGLDPHVVRFDQLSEYMPELEELTWSLEEPFDNYMTLQQMIYLEARRSGVKVVLDGVAGDIVLGEGSHLVRLLRRGRWCSALREALGQQRYYGSAYAPWTDLLRSARAALIPNSVRRLRQRVTGRRRLHRRARRRISESKLNPDFARRIDLEDRLRVLHEQSPAGIAPDYVVERARSIDHAYLTVGRERYDRIAAAIAIEPRDPFLDKRVVDYCVALPGDQRLKGGWPKEILRRSMSDSLPNAVVWRRGKEHLGWAFTLAFIDIVKDHMKVDIAGRQGTISTYLNWEAIDWLRSSKLEDAPAASTQTMYDAAHLGTWLGRHRERPRLRHN